MRINENAKVLLRRKNRKKFQENMIAIDFAFNFLNIFGGRTVRYRKRIPYIRSARKKLE